MTGPGDGSGEVGFGVLGLLVCGADPVQNIDLRVRGSGRGGWPLPRVERRVWHEEHSAMVPNATVAVSVQWGLLAGLSA